MVSQKIAVSGAKAWSDGAMVLGKLPVPERPTNMDLSMARAFCACSRCGWGLFVHFVLLYLFSLLSPSLYETARYRLKYCPKGPLSPKQPTNKPTQFRNILYAKTNWLVGCFGLNGPLRQYFSLYRAVSQREGERKEK